MSEYYLTRSDELYHYGVAGQKWGRRQYQNQDGSLTDLGRQHYGYGPGRGSVKGTAYRALSKVYGLNERAYNRLGNRTAASMNKSAKNEMLRKAAKADEDRDKYRNSEEYKERKAKVVKAAKIGAAVAATALAAYGGYKLSQYIKANRIASGKNLAKTEKFQKTLQEKYFALSMRSNKETGGKSNLYGDRAKAMNKSIADTHAQMDKARERALKNINKNYAGLDAQRKLDSTVKSARSKITSARDTAKLNATARSINRDLKSAPAKASLDVAQKRIRDAAAKASNSIAAKRSASEAKKVQDLYNEARSIASRAKYYQARRIAPGLDASAKATAAREYSKLLSEMSSIENKLAALVNRR